MKIIYAGTPNFAVLPLLSLIASDYDVVAVYTQPDRPAGRGRKILASAVKQAAMQENIKVMQPVTFRDPAVVQEFMALNADIMVVAAYGLILPEEVLSIPKHGCINIHASLLPRWRGAAPIQRAILAGDEKTGITIMQMARGLDTGDILYQLETPLTDADTSSSLHDRLSQLGAEALLKTLAMIQTSDVSPQVQDDSQALYADKLSKAEATINWNQDASQIVRMINAFNPWPVAQTCYGKHVLRLRQAEFEGDKGILADMMPGTVITEQRRKGILVATGSGGVWLTNLQLPGKKPLQAADFLNANSLKGQVLGN